MFCSSEPADAILRRVLLSEFHLNPTNRRKRSVQIKAILGARRADISVDMRAEELFSRARLTLNDLSKICGQFAATSDAICADKMPRAANERAIIPPRISLA